MKEIHGGDVYRNQITMDFSINVNPLGMPEAVRNALHEAVENCGRYPDIREEALKRAAGEMLKTPEEYLLFGNGASELLMACVHAVQPAKTAIPVPSFYGYEYAAKGGGGEILYYEMKEERGFLPEEDLYMVLTEDIGMLFLANPGNPAGTVIDRKYLKKLLSHCRKKGIYVVLDECFVEFCREDHSMLGEIEKYENLILVRAFTKIFAIPGVRLGYLVCSNKKLLHKIAGQLPEWNISSFAHAAGVVCAGQQDFLHQTKVYVEKERYFLEEGLKKSGIQVISGRANFLLIYSELDLYEELLKKGILIRSCENFRGLTKGFYRIAVRCRKENEMLLKALGEIKWKN